MDDGTVDGLVLVVLTFIGGLFYGAAGYFLLGLALWLGAKGVGVEAPFRIARQLVAFAAVPIALSLVVVVPVIAVRYGWDWFRTTGSDTRSERGVVVGIGLAFMAWSVALVALGLRTTFRLPWRGVVGALLLAGVMVAAFAVLPIALYALRPRSRPSERPELLVRHRVRVHLLGEAVLADVLGVCRDGVADDAREIRVLLHEPRRLAVVEPEEVVPDEHLPVGAAARADADRGHGEVPGDLVGNRGRHRFEHDREAASRLECAAVVDEPPCLVGRPALGLEAA